MKKRFEKESRKKRGCLGKFLLAAVLLLAIYTLIENFTIGTTYYEVTTGKLPEDFAGLRIVQLSDIHTVPNETWGEAIYRKTKAENPDIIALTGDLVDNKLEGNETRREQTLELCRRLCEIAPVYFVYGNHEFVLLDDPEKNEFKCALEDMGVIIFNNSYGIFEKDGQVFDIFGVQDPATLYKDPVYCDADTSDILEDLAVNLHADRVSVLLAHRPELFETYTEEFDFDVTLTGHAHGGQFRIPFLNVGIYAPNQGFFPEYTEGTFESNGNTMIISRGIGESTCLFRLFNMPEIVVVDIK